MNADKATTRVFKSTYHLSWLNMCKWVLLKGIVVEVWSTEDGDPRNSCTSFQCQRSQNDSPSRYLEVILSTHPFYEAGTFIDPSICSLYEDIETRYKKHLGDAQGAWRAMNKLSGESNERLNRKEETTSFWKLEGFSIGPGLTFCTIF